MAEKSYDEIMAILEERQEPIGEELMDIPIKSSEEFIEFMYKIRDLNLTENGRKVYAFGYAGDGTDNWEALVYLGISFPVCQVLLLASSCNQKNLL